MKKMNGGNGAVLRGNCAFNVGVGQKKRLGGHGTQSEGSGRGGREKEREYEQCLDGE